MEPATTGDGRGSAFNRRDFIGACAASGMGAAAGAARAEATDSAGVPAANAAAGPEATFHLSLRVNGEQRTLDIDPRASLLDVLREHLALTGSKKGCDHGQCGACTVLLDGRRVLSCLSLAARCEGRAVETIEGLAAAGGAPHPMQAAFVEHDALQCGYCTPGQIMSAIGCVHEGHAGDEESIREYMSGNLCRCGAYPNIVAAIRQARAIMEAT